MTSTTIRVEVITKFDQDVEAILNHNLRFLHPHLMQLHIQMVELDVEIIKTIYQSITEMIISNMMW
jgi:hypothetical protein